MKKNELIVRARDFLVEQYPIVKQLSDRDLSRVIGIEDYIVTMMVNFHIFITALEKEQHKVWLEELNRILDEALAKETNESIKQFVLKNRERENNENC